MQLQTIPLEFLIIAMLALASMAVPVCALLIQPERLNEPLDRVFMGQAAAWLLALAVMGFGLGLTKDDNYSVWQMLIYHLLYATTASFLLSCANLSHTLFSKWVSLYAVLGVIAIFAGLDSSNTVGVNGVAFGTVWALLTLITATLTLVVLMLKLRSSLDAIHSLLVVAAWWGWSLVLNDLGANLFAKLQGRMPEPINLSAVHILFSAYLVALWLLFTGRARWMIVTTEKTNAEANGYVSLSSLDMSGSSGAALAGHQDSGTAAAVADERRRIAQDIHDGVGAQLVGLIASLDTTSPQHRRVMLGLERCLLDLKTTVDNVEGSDDSDTNIFDALGRLRYRFQPSLTRAGIRMLWKVDVAGPLIAVRPSQLEHVMRIVQECLANVLLHSEAKAVRLVCRYEDEPLPRMMLEVLDDGIGIARRETDEVTGKGLSGMKERAQRIGATLQIGTKAGAGTRVRLYLPLA
jgi:signal transduction histidine kinase